jgi:hypothetical protein
MRAGNLRSLSTRDHVAIRERLEFARAEQEREEQAAAEKRLAEDRIEFDKAMAAQHRVVPAERIAVEFAEFHEHCDPSESDTKTRAAKAFNALLSKRVAKVGKDAVTNGTADPEFALPKSAAGLRMSVEQAKEYARKQAEIFTAQNPEYNPTPDNLKLITNYLTTNGVVIPTAECLQIAFERLRTLGLLKEKPPAPEPISEPVIAEPEVVDDGSQEGICLATGEPMKFSAYQISHMSSDEYRRVFRVVPKFTRSRYQ